MKLILAITALAGLSSAACIEARDVLNCDAAPGIRADILSGKQNDGTLKKTMTGSSTLEECRAKCYSPDYAECKMFAYRASSGGGSCHIYNVDLADFNGNNYVKPTEATTTTWFFKSAPAGVRGWVPENVLKHYRAVTDKTMGTYAKCRKECLSDAQCVGFGYKEGGNCQLYDKSLKGRVKADTSSPYIHYQIDCARV